MNDGEAKRLYSAFAVKNREYMDYNDSMAASMPTVRTMAEKCDSDALGDDVCHEDVLTDMIKSGAVIKVYDEEGGEYVGELSLNKIEANWGSIRSEDIMDVLKENDDSDTADNILQSLIFGDIIYG